MVGDLPSLCSEVPMLLLLTHGSDLGSLGGHGLPGFYLDDVVIFFFLLILFLFSYCSFSQVPLFFST